MTPNSAINSDSKKRRTFVAPIFAANTVNVMVQGIVHG
jgi:hypothetical protein